MNTFFSFMLLLFFLERISSFAFLGIYFLNFLCVLLIDIRHLFDFCKVLKTPFKCQAYVLGAIEKDEHGDVLRLT